MTTRGAPPAPPSEAAPASTRRQSLRRWTGWLGLVLLVGLGVVFAFGDRLPFGPQMTIVSGESMEPTMHTGDVLITRSRDRYSVGEQVVYRVPRGEPGEGGSVVHRIVGSDEYGYLMQGDNNSFRDPWRPSDGDIVGTRVLLVPGLGWVLAYLSQPVVMGAIAGGLITGLLTYSSLSRNEEDRGADAAGEGEQAPAPVIDLTSKPEIDLRPGPEIDLRAQPGIDPESGSPSGLPREARDE